MAVELFADLAQTTVTSGGTTAPAAGTQETWTVTSSAAFPAASSTATPPGQFHVSDPAASTELIKVINVSGTTWTVIRGDESTTPVTHSSSGFTVNIVTSAAALTQLRVTDWLNVVTMFAADPTGTSDSTTAISNAISAMPSTGGVIYFPAGTYKVSSSLTISQPGVYLQGAGMDTTFISYTGSGDCIRMYSPNSYSSGWGGGIKGIVIDGTSASAGACGAHLGDIYQLQLDFGVRNFQGTNSKGIWFDNQYYWAENMYGHVWAEKNTSNVTFDNSANLSGSATGSFARANLTIVLDCKGVGNGIIVKNGAQLYGATLNWAGNMDYSTTGTKYWALTIAAPAGFSYTATNASPAVFTATGMYYGNGTTVFLGGGTAPTGFTNGQAYYVVNTNISAGTFQLSATSGGTAINSTSTGSGTVNTFTATTIRRSLLNINIECNATSGTQPGTIDFTSSTSANGYNSINGCTGVIDFSGNNAFASAANSYQNFFFDGPVYGDGSLWRSTGLGQSIYFNGSLASNATITSNVSLSRVNTSSNLTGMILANGSTDTQLLIVEANGAGSITFDVQATSHVKSGTSCVIAANTAMMFVWDTNQSLWYALSN